MYSRRRAAAMVVALSLVSGSGCDEETNPPAGPVPLEVLTTAALAPALADFVALLPYPDAVLKTVDDPVAALAAPAHDASTLRVALVAQGELDCSECYRLRRATPTDNAFVVDGDGALGVQYGLAALLEQAGVRFYHPFHTLAPATLTVPGTPDNLPVVPALALRGLHLHTIHPTEAYWAFWEPSDAHLADARRVVDWLVKNRGNYLQWVALADIQEDEERAAAWKPHTRAIIDLAHARGVKVGVGVQLFGLSNVQHGWDLIDKGLAAEPARDQIDARLPQLVDDLPWDRINLSFGEFFSAPPDDFIHAVDEAYDALQTRAPGTEMAATIHMGNSEDQRVDYMGETLQYYFLVKYANPAIVPWVHTVMYFDLFDPAVGAYGYDDFTEHRTFLLDRLAAGQRAAYFPESAYWVAFDVSVPQYLPVYMTTRARDLAQIAAASPGAPLAEHVLFSSGWEWGYWQNDVVTLRMTYDGDFFPQHQLEALWAPYGEAGAALATALVELGERQRERLILGGLAPYIAGRDIYIDTGFQLGVIAQPDRVSYAAAAAMDADARAEFETRVLGGLAALGDETQAALDAVHAAGLPAGDPFVAEIVDGLEVDLARIRMQRAAYAAAFAFGGGAAGTTELAAAEAATADARVVVLRRHAALHDPAHAEIAEPNVNATIYAFGYLGKADELCYWERELAELRNLLGVSKDVPPACVM
jgi:hypothetical protein